MKARVAGSVRHENKWKHTQLHLKRNEESKNLNMCICYHDSSFLVLDPNCKSLQTNIQRSYITYVEAKRERKLLYSSSEHHLTMHVFFQEMESVVNQQTDKGHEQQTAPVSTESTI